MSTIFFLMHSASLLQLVHFFIVRPLYMCKQIIVCSWTWLLGTFFFLYLQVPNEIHYMCPFLINHDSILRIQSYFAFSGPSSQIRITFCLGIHILQELKCPPGKVACFSDCRFFKIEAQTANAHWVAPDTAPCPTSTYSALAQLCRSTCLCWRPARVTGQSLGS